MRVFIDFQNKVPHRVYLPDEDKVYRVRDENLIDFLEITGVNEVYIESAPRGWIYRLLENNIMVYILRYKNQSKLRKQYGLRKNHSNDARLLHLIYKKHSEYFRKYSKRQLDNNQDIQKYIFILREIKRVRQKIKVNEKLGLPTEKLEEYLWELQKEQARLSYYLRKRYKSILDKFSDVKGLAGGNLLYFLTLIPDVNSFRSIRSFLIYLGLRATDRKTWNREARDVLTKIAMKTAKYNNIKFNQRKPNWKYLRKLAIHIYTRLKDYEV